MNLSYKITDDLKINVYNDICLQGIIDYPKFENKDDCEKFVKNYFQYLNDAERTFIKNTNIKKYSIKYQHPYCYYVGYYFLNSKLENYIFSKYIVPKFTEIDRFNCFTSIIKIYYNHLEKRYYFVLNDEYVYFFCDYISDSDICDIYGYFSCNLIDTPYHFLLEHYFLKKFKTIKLHPSLRYYFYSTNKKYLTNIKNIYYL